MKQYGIYDKRAESYRWNRHGDVFVFNNMEVAKAQLNACWQVHYQDSTSVPMSEVLEIREFLEDEE